FPERFHIPVKGFFKLKLNDTHFIYLEGHYTSFITRRLFWHGVKGFEYESVRVFMKIIGSCGVFMDIGANMGYYSLIAARVNPNMKIIAFEPFPDALTAFRRNIDRNDFRNIEIEEIALSDQQGETKLFYRINTDFPDELQLAGNNTMVKFNDNRTETITVKTTTLDRYTKDKNLDRLEVIKIDTETTEYLILSNGKEVIRKFRPVVICEVLCGFHEQELQNLFDPLDYEIYRVEDVGLVKAADLISEKGENFDYYFVPVEKKDWINQFVKN
ncbi:MAG: FkbM family methyltransferase, partial [Bacteroidales bacterium]|nr:FkbM family methyltransferase [Bacteroidales bacterium]